MYRLFNADGELLYVGISYSAIARFAQHRADKSWIDEVARIDIKQHNCSRAEVFELERQAIEQEKPKYNRTHVGARPRMSAVVIDRPRRSFDHSRFALHEDCAVAYQQLVAGLDGLWGHIERNDLADNHREATLAVAAEVMDALEMPDMHHGSLRRDAGECGGGLKHEYPFRHDGDRWAYFYCGNCDAYWRCGY
jgi:predicted GIY-YIG superfamily endonuclease